MNISLSYPQRLIFQNQVWEVVRHIPSGKVFTYGQIAKLIPAPLGTPPERYRAFGARWVGGAMADCPDTVPWFRVVNAQGFSSLPEAGAQEQRALLEAEGVEFDERGRVEMELFRWEGPGM